MSYKAENHIIDVTFEIGTINSLTDAEFIFRKWNTSCKKALKAFLSGKPTCTLQRVMIRYNEVSLYMLYIIQHRSR